MDHFIFKVSSFSDGLSESKLEEIKERLSAVIMADKKLSKLLNVTGPDSLWYVHSTED